MRRVPLQVRQDTLGYMHGSSTKQAVVGYMYAYCMLWGCRQTGINSTNDHITKECCTEPFVAGAVLEAIGSIIPAPYFTSTRKRPVASIQVLAYTRRRGNGYAISLAMLSLGARWCTSACNHQDILIESPTCTRRVATLGAKKDQVWKRKQCCGGGPLKPLA